MKTFGERVRLAVRDALKNIAKKVSIYNIGINHQKEVKQIDASFVYPYSSDNEIKRQQIWNNLQKGLLFEDTQVLIPWQMPYSEIDKYAEQRTNSGDRTNWFLGEHKICDTFNCFVEVMKWSWIEDSRPFSKISDYLGDDDNGNKRFLELKEKFTNLLGEPTDTKLEKFGDNDLGSIIWKNGKVEIALTGIEQFACKYRISIGLIENYQNIFNL